jgi:hypothetical protein
MEDNVRMDLKEIGWEGVAEDTEKWQALVNAEMKLRIP